MKTILYTFTSIVAVALLTVPTRADDKADRAGLIGSWVQNGGTHAWIIAAQSDGLHVTEIENSTPIADFQCSTFGDNCEVKISGHKATVSMYYNGSALVQLETKGDEIVKRRFSASGDSMKVEVTPMTGHLQPEERDFERGQPQIRKK